MSQHPLAERATTRRPARVAAAAASSALLAAGIIGLSAAPAHATDYPVTDYASLVAAINGAGDGDTITFGSGITVTLTGALPLINDDVDIIGNGATIDGGGSWGGPEIDLASVTVTDLSIVDMTGEGLYVTNSQAVLTNVEANNNAANGLKVENTDAGTSIEILDSSFSGNAENGARIQAEADSTVTVTTSSFTGNQFVGLYVQTIDDAVAVITGSTADDNDISDGFGLYADGDSSITASDLAASGNGSDGAEVGTSNGASLEITDSDFSGNDDNGIDAYASDGSEIVASGVVIDGNVAEGLYAGASDDSVTTYSFFTIADNGSGVQTNASSGGIVNVTDSTIDGNEDAGLGIDASGDAFVSLTSSTISNNGVIGVTGDISAATAAVVNSTITHNGEFTDCVGGIEVFGDEDATFFLAHSTVYENYSTGGCPQFGGNGLAITITHSIIAGSDWDVAQGSGAFDLWTIEYSLIGIADLVGETNGFEATALLEDAAADPTNILGEDPLLGSLADNGGTTLTLLPQDGSPVIDAGDASIKDVDGLPLDQRGADRVQGYAPDMGAVETEAALAATGADPAAYLGGASVLLLFGTALIAARGLRRRATAG